MSENIFRTRRRPVDQVLSTQQGVTVDPSRFELVSLNLFLLNKKPLSVLVRFNFCKQKLNRTVYKN